MGNSIVKVEHLSHRYSVQWAVRDINLDITENGIYGLLGSNGAGKSTTMNIMCGVLKQTEGNVYIQGINLKEDPVEAKKHLGFLPQKPPLQGDLTVEEFLSYVARVRQVERSQVKKTVEDVLERCGIMHFRKRLIRNLSGGYQQRVGIAQAIVHQPEFVVLDEPTNGLDPNQILEVRRLIKDIAAERTVILSTHILSEVQAICDYIYMIEQGRLVFNGTIDEFDNYIVPNTLLVTLRAAQLYRAEHLACDLACRSHGRGAEGHPRPATGGGTGKLRLPALLLRRGGGHGTGGGDERAARLAADHAGVGEMLDG